MYKCVATYATDNILLQLQYPIPDETYAGQVRVLELLRSALLIDVSNVGSKNIDDVINYVMNNPDESEQY